MTTAIVTRYGKKRCPDCKKAIEVGQSVISTTGWRGKKTQHHETCQISKWRFDDGQDEDT